jgi:ribulose 1,5-bisphosphate synthetase/thiazole synthase
MKKGIIKSLRTMVAKIDLETKHLNVVIIGGGQAGLATGYFLKKAEQGVYYS